MFNTIHLGAATSVSQEQNIKFLLRKQIFEEVTGVFDCLDFMTVNSLLLEVFSAICVIQVLGSD